MPADKLTRFLEELFSYLGTRVLARFLAKSSTLKAPWQVGSTYQGWLFFRESEWAAERSTKPNFIYSWQSIQSSATCVGVEGVEGMRAGWTVQGTVGEHETRRGAMRERRRWQKGDHDPSSELSSAWNLKLRKDHLPWFWAFFTTIQTPFIFLSFTIAQGPCIFSVLGNEHI